MQNGGVVAKCLETTVVAHITDKRKYLTYNNVLNNSTFSLFKKKQMCMELLSELKYYLLCQMVFTNINITLYVCELTL